MILGAHFSIAGGLSKALETAKELDCNALQMFIRSPRTYKTKEIDEETAADFKKKRKKYLIKKVAVHAGYVQNLASAKEHFYKASIDINLADIRESVKIGADYYVLHLGSYKDSTLEKGLERLVKAIKHLSENIPSGIKILLENVSGAKNLIGSELEELGYILKELKYPKNVGICIDTCHAWCFGYNIRTPKGLESFVDKIESTVGINRVELIHLNDTKEKFESKHDRHSNIGEGELGKRGIGLFINHPKLKNIPYVLETPKKEKDDDKKNIELVRKLKK